MAIDQYGRFIRTAPAPRIQTNYNTTTSSSTGNYRGRYSSYSFWDRFNDGVARIGNWIDDIIEPVSGWLTIIGLVIGAIGLISWIFNDSNIFYIVLRCIGACFIGGLMFYVVAINTFLISLILKIVRFIFWNGWTLLIALALASGIWICAVSSTTPNTYTSAEQPEAYTRIHEKYRCTAAVLNVRIHPNKSSRVLGTLHRGQEIEVIDKENGFAVIEYKGQRGYASLKYLNKTY